MPFYTVNHSYPLTTSQKSELANAITHIHSSKFLTPSIYVHVKFDGNDASKQNYFIAGKVRVNCTNYITGLVRTSNERTQQDWTEMAQRIEDAWYTAVSGPIIEEGKNQGKRESALEDSDTTRDAKGLRLVTFYPMVSVWENGGQIPPAGQEAQWFKENREHFQARADAGDELYTEMMQEVTTREDLKKAYGA